MLTKMKSENRESRKRKKKKISRGKKKDRLVKDISNTRKTGQGFLNINSPWNLEGTNLFNYGLSKSKGICRTLYAETVGFTQQYILSSNLERLRHAARNVRIKFDDTTTQQDLQTRLLLFLLYDCQVHKEWSMSRLSESTVLVLGWLNSLRRLNFVSCVFWCTFEGDG